MERSAMSRQQDQFPGMAIDLQLVAQRILKLAEISMLDHMESLARSQATGIAELDGQGHVPPAGRGRRMCPGE